MYLAYFIALMSIGAVWIEHSARTEARERVAASLLRLNLLRLVCALRRLLRRGDG